MSPDLAELLLQSASVINDIEIVIKIAMTTSDRE